MSEGAPIEPKRLADIERPTVLEHRQRLSASMLWARQRAFYERETASAWGLGTVPHYITCNPTIADRYAEQVVAFLHDCRSAGALPTGSPVHVVELGAGSGRFAYLVQQALRRRLVSSLPDVRLTYVLTDFTDTRLEEWLRHPRLEPLVADGLVDVARFDAAEPGNLHLEASGLVLDAATVDGPVVLLANYVLDSLPQDCFAVRGGQLLACLVTATAADADADLADFALSFDLEPCREPATDDPELGLILEQYRATLDDTNVLLPTAAIDCIRWFAELAGDRPLLVVAADKGYAQPRHLLGRNEPQVVLHGSCFSLMVNFDAIGRWVRRRGGLVLHPAHQPAHLVVAAYVLGRTPETWPETTRCYADLAEAGPDDWFALKSTIDTSRADLTLDQLLGVLRMSRWDPSVFVESFSRLLDAAAEAPEAQRADVHLAVRRVWEQYFPIGDHSDVASCLALVLSAIRYYRESLELFEQSLRLRGPSANALFGMAVSHYGLRDLELARKRLHEVLDLEPGFSGARTLLVTVESELGAESEGQR